MFSSLADGRALAPGQLHCFRPALVGNRSAEISARRWLTGRSRLRVPCRAGHDAQQAVASGEQSESGKEDGGRIKQTLLGLDALLGVQEEPVKKEEPSKAASEDTGTSVSPAVLQQIAEAEAARAANQGNGAKSTEAGMSEQMNKIVDQARRLAEQDNAGTSNAGEQALRKEFETLLQMLKPDGGVEKEDIKVLKEKVFRQQSFWVTETRAADTPEGGLLVRGNMRGEAAAVFEAVCEAVQKEFGDKYTVFMVEDGEAEPMGDEALRPAFQIAPTSAALPRPTAGWQLLAAVVLLGLTVASSVQVGLVANIAKLPKETLDWLSQPDSLDAGVLPPGLETWDPTPYLSTAVPITLGVFGVALARELGFRAAAAVKGVKLGPAYFVPNGQIGSFGSTTPLKSLVRNHTDLFDLAFTGVAAGGGLALSLFLAGLAATAAGDLPQELLVPVPSQLFQGSLLLGATSKLALGSTLVRTGTVYVHPYLIAGWCGLVAMALQSLPVGSIDGGRMMQSAFGRGSLALSGFFTYIGLGLGFLGSSLSLPFGLYVLICQRSAERYVQDNVSSVSEGRRIAAAVAVIFAILVLLPMAPELADTVGVGPGSPFL